MKRREFIKVTAGAVLGGVATGVAGRTVAGKPNRPLTLVCRDVHLKATGLADSWSAMKELGVAGVEVVVDEELTCPSLYHPNRRYRIGTAEDCKVLEADMQEAGRVITAFCLNNRLDERLDQEAAWAGKVVAAAEKMKVNVIRIDVVPRALSKEDFPAFAIRACQQLCERVEGGLVRYGIENHGTTTNDPAFLVRPFDGVGSKHLGVTLDAVQLLLVRPPAGQPLRDLREVRPGRSTRTARTSAIPTTGARYARPMGWEYARYTCPVDEGDIDYGKVVRCCARRVERLCLEERVSWAVPGGGTRLVLKREIATLRQVASRHDQAGPSCSASCNR